jgi:hypothetical protein
MWKNTNIFYIFFIGHWANLIKVIFFAPGAPPSGSAPESGCMCIVHACTVTKINSKPMDWVLLKSHQSMQKSIGWRPMSTWQSKELTSLQDSYFLFADFFDFLYTFNIHLYIHIFRRIFLGNYWWQESDIWSRAYFVCIVHACTVTKINSKPMDRVLLKSHQSMQVTHTLYQQWPEWMFQCLKLSS